MQNADITTVYTIGHSNHAIEAFIDLLRRHDISAVADVRSTPYSRRHPQFNKRDLQSVLQEAGIAYVFLGAELGARPKDRACYRDGRADYGLIAATPLFRSGIDRVLKGAQSHRVALMCAEREPLNCHRTILVGRRLAAEGVALRHILADGGIEEHGETERHLLQLTQQETADLFDGDTLQRAYDIRGGEMGYKEPD